MMLQDNSQNRPQKLITIEIQPFFGNPLFATKMIKSYFEPRNQEIYTQFGNICKGFVFNIKSLISCSKIFLQSIIFETAASFPFVYITEGPLTIGIQTISSSLPCKTFYSNAKSSLRTNDLLPHPMIQYISIKTFYRPNSKISHFISTQRLKLDIFLVHSSAVKMFPFCPELVSQN